MPTQYACSFQNILSHVENIFGFVDLVRGEVEYRVTCPR